jgi:hypothetical protein
LRAEARNRRASFFVLSLSYEKIWESHMYIGLGGLLLLIILLIVLF